MVKLEIRDWDATEFDCGRGFEEFDIYRAQNDLEFFEHFSLHLRFTVGTVGELGADYFSVMVLSYDSALAQHGSDRRKIVLPLFDVEIAQRIVERTVKFVGEQNPSNWGVALSRYFHWEYENMQELTPEQTQEMIDEGLWEDE